jgi:peptide methionine sulfoxide reductase msrA/msrB
MIKVKKILLVVLALVISFVIYNTYDRATSPQFIQDKKISENTEYEKIVLSGGCFWCTESEFNHVLGIISAVSGYADSDKANPSYSEVGGEKVKAREAVEVIYDPKIISISKVLEIYFRHIDPTDGGGQFADRGYQYTSAIYFTKDAQEKLALYLKQKINESKKFTTPVVTEILPFRNFYAAEEYHQDYKDKNGLRYQAYREASGRNKFIRENWLDESFGVRDIFKNTNIMEENKINSSASWINLTAEEKENKIKTLSAISYKVTQEEGTETPFANEYESNKEKGIYVDIVSGEPLYLSSDKYDSGTGWPSFVKPVSEEALTLHIDKKIFSTRVEVRSRIANSHLGHVFEDGPLDRGGKRYCMNSAAMRFISVADMEKEGYGDFINKIN